MVLLRCWISWAWFGFRMGWWKLRYSARERALIMVRQGVYYDLEMAHSIYRGKQGAMYSFGDTGIAYALDEPIAKELRARKRDSFEVYEDERLLFMVDGEVVACPVAGTGVLMEDTALSEFNRGDAVHQALQSIQGPAHGFGGNWKLLLAIGAIAIIVFVIYKFVLHGQIPGMGGTPTNTPTPTPTPAPFVPMITQWLIWLVMNV